MKKVNRLKMLAKFKTRKMLYLVILFISLNCSNQKPEQRSSANTDKIPVVPMEWIENMII